MILNLVGPPGVGKSSLVNEILKSNKQSHILYLDIARYKEQFGNLDEAWTDLAYNAYSNRHRNIIIESCGTDWRMEKLHRINRPICTIFLYGDIKRIEKQIKERTKDPELADLEIQEAIFTLNNLYNQKLAVNYIINTDNKSIQEIYELAKEKIALFKENRRKNASTRCKSLSS